MEPDTANPEPDYPTQEKVQGISLITSKIEPRRNQRQLLDYVEERRPYTDFGLNIGGGWFRSFAAGVAITLIGIVASLWRADRRGIRDIAFTDAIVTRPDKPLLIGVVF